MASKNTRGVKILSECQTIDIRRLSDRESHTHRLSETWRHRPGYQDTAQPHPLTDTHPQQHPNPKSHVQSNTENHKLPVTKFCYLYQIP